MARSGSGLGYFIEHDLWEQGIKLLDFQLSLKRVNRHFNTLSMIYYARLAKDDRAKVRHRSYFKGRIANNLMYGLRREFAVHHYPIPKSNLGIRKYSFLTYPLRIAHYTLCIYILRVAQEFLAEYHRKCPKIHSGYGGRLDFDEATGAIRLGPDTVLYKKHYLAFRSAVRRELRGRLATKIVIKLDIENYFEDVSIRILLDHLKSAVKPSIQRKLRFDVTTIEQIASFYHFLAGASKGIPQADNDVCSNFMGFLYLVFGDLTLDQRIAALGKVVKDWAVIRYVDDIYISISFDRRTNRREREAAANLLAAEIADGFYRELGLRLNAKTQLYWLDKKPDRRDLLQSLKRVSPGYDLPSGGSRPVSVQRRVQSILSRLENLKGTSPFASRDDLTDEVFKEIYEADVQAEFRKRPNLARLRSIFGGFNFDLIVGQTREIVLLILLDKGVEKRFRSFLLSKSVITFRDAHFILTYLCQSRFRATKLLDQLRTYPAMSRIVTVFLAKTTYSTDPGYHDMPERKTLRIAGFPNVIEQIRLRAFAEQRGDYSVALNHLLNEIQSVCHRVERSPVQQKAYTANHVDQFLQRMALPHDVRIGVRNLFDRRNKNPVAHADEISWPVEEQEFVRYREVVAQVLRAIL
ncbi:MAG: AbiA family abortive infection protein [Chloroflexota bacterium]